MLNPNRLGQMVITDFIPIDLFAKIYSFTVANGTIGTTMEMGLDLNTAAAEVVANAGITADRQLITNTPVLAHSAGAGNPPFEEIGTTGTVGCKMNTADDLATLFMRIPDKWDFRSRLRFRVVWATDSVTVTDTVTWTVLYKSYIPGAAAIIVPATALSTAIAADSPSATAKSPLQSPWGILDGATLAKANAFIGLTLKMDAKVAITEDIWALGLEVEYTERRGRGLQKTARRFARSQD